MGFFLFSAKTNEDKFWNWFCKKSMEKESLAEEFDRVKLSLAK